MSILSRRDIMRLLIVGILLILPAASKAQQNPPIVEKLAKTYGLDSFEQIEAIRYTFNAQLPGIDVSRSWIWEPKSDQVTYEGKDKSGKPIKLTYLRSKLDGQSGEIEPSFVNDQYWLLLPLHASWDTGAAVEDAGMQKLPLGQGSAEKIVLKYPTEGGSSPGDTWDLYIGTDGRIQEIGFHRGGTATPSLVIASWADHKKAGPLLFALDHQGTADGKPLRVWFSNVAVRLKGSDIWIAAQ